MRNKQCSCKHQVHQVNNLLDDLNDIICVKLPKYFHLEE